MVASTRFASLLVLLAFAPTLRQGWLLLRRWPEPLPQTGAMAGAATSRKRLLPRGAVVMRGTRRVSMLLMVSWLALGAVACEGPTPPLPTAPREATVAEAATLAERPSATPSGHPSPSATPTAAPTATPSTTPTATPSPAPTVTPWTGRLPAGTVALLGIGSWQYPQLHALAADGSLADLGRAVTETSIASASGRWVVRLDRAEFPRAMVLDDLVTGVRHAIRFLERADAVGYWTFSCDEARLASLEVAPRENGYCWAIVIVSLADGAVARYEMAGGFDVAAQGETPPWPGIPLGWTAGEELLLATFRPYTEGWAFGVWAVTIPQGASSRPLAELAARELLPAGAAWSLPRLSPDGTRLLYLARDRSYTPADYRSDFPDLTVNQLWSLDLAGGTPELLHEVTDGGALGDDVAWSPDGAQVLFAEGRYAGGETLATSTLKVWDRGTVRELGPLPAQGYPWRLDWCRPETAFVTLSAGGVWFRLYTVDLATGEETLVASARHVSVVACLRP